MNTNVKKGVTIIMIIEWLYGFKSGLLLNINMTSGFIEIIGHISNVFYSNYCYYYFMHNNWDYLKTDDVVLDI